MVTKAEIKQFGEDIDRLVAFVREYKERDPQDYQQKFIFSDEKEKATNNLQDFVSVINGDLGMLQLRLKQVEEKKGDENRIARFTADVLRYIPITDKNIKKIRKEITNEDDANYKLCNDVLEQLEKFQTELSGAKPAPNASFNNRL